MTQLPLILASGSPRRRELLRRVGIEVEVRPAEIDESVIAGEQALAYGRRVARQKAQAVQGLYPERWLLAADTVVEIRGAILGKAGTSEEAQILLQSLLGDCHRVHTAVCLCGPGGFVRQREITTEVVMRSPMPGEVSGYVASGEWRGKAGAYALQGMAAAFVSEIRGSVTNVIGLPLCEVIESLAEAGFAVPDYTKGVPA